MSLGRLLQADVGELANRLGQEAQRRLDRLAISLRPGAPPLPLFSHLRADVATAGFTLPGGQAGAFAADLGVDCARFFAGAESGGARVHFATRLRAAREHVLVSADALCQGRFDLLGYSGLSLGDRIDWHRDPVSGREAPRTHWSRIDPLDAASVGDCKLTWELNRHQWFLELGEAYQFTGDERYARRFAECVRSWMGANPPGVGINWASSLEVAYRLVAWSWSLVLFRGSDALTPRLEAEMRAWIRVHAAHVERYPSHYFSPNTHLTGEALGLFYAGVLFPDLPGAIAWRDLGMRILLKHLPRQVLPDGVYFEQSTCYQRYTVDIYLQFMILARRNGIALPDSVARQIQGLLDYLLALRRPDGSMPQVGDEDGGRLLPLLRRSPEDCRDVFALGAALFRRPDYAWAAEGEAPEVFWLLGPKGCQAFESLEPSPPAAPPSQLFHEGGMAVMRSGWERQAHQLLFDVGPLGCPLSGGHGHADLLSLQCAVHGEAQLVDPGTYCYTLDAGWRGYFRGSAAHSTVTIDGLGQAEPAGPFKWHRRSRARLLRWTSTAAFDFADAEHDAYAALPDPVRHRRRVFFAKPRWWVVVDDLYGAAAHRVELCFQFAPSLVSLNAGEWAEAEGQEGQRLLVRAFTPHAIQAELIEGALDPIRGWVSAAYGQKQPAPALLYSLTAPLPLRIATLMVPADTAAVPDVQASYAGDAWRLDFTGTRETLHLDDKDIRLECAASQAY